MSNRKIRKNTESTMSNLSFEFWPRWYAILVWRWRTVFCGLQTKIDLTSIQLIKIASSCFKRLRGSQGLIRSIYFDRFMEDVPVFIESNVSQRALSSSRISLKTCSRRQRHCSVTSSLLCYRSPLGLSRNAPWRRRRRRRRRCVTSPNGSHLE